MIYNDNGAMIYNDNGVMTDNVDEYRVEADGWSSSLCCRPDLTQQPRLQT